MTHLREPAELSTGELLDGRYLLRERIGQGGMACVYRADDTHLQRTVAVKVFRGADESISSVERAQSETLLLASVNHHALVTVLDARVSSDDTSYLVMEYVDGITLRELLLRGRLDPLAAAALGIDLAEALHTAHEAGIVHRDIKPSNVLLARSALPGWGWHAKLADFGIAHLRDSSRLTTPGLMLGTAAYVAPEQARGAPPAPPADIYAFGIMLIEALTGHRPFSDAEGIGTVMARLASPPEVSDALPAQWQGLLRGMTAIRPDDRPTALDVALTLSSITAPDRAAASHVLDEVTVPFIPPPAAGPAPVVVPAAKAPEPTVVLPGIDAAAADSASHDEQDAAASGSSGTTGRAASPNRRNLVMAALGALAVLGALVGALWLSGQPGAQPEPAPTAPAVQEGSSPSPTVQTPSAPSPAVVGGGGGQGGGGDHNSGNGNGNDNGNGGSNGNGHGKGKGNE